MKPSVNKITAYRVPGDKYYIFIVIKAFSKESWKKNKHYYSNYPVFSAFKSFGKQFIYAENAQKIIQESVKMPHPIKL